MGTGFEFLSESFYPDQMNADTIKENAGDMYRQAEPEDKQYYCSLTFYSRKYYEHQNNVSYEFSLQLLTKSHNNKKGHINLSLVSLTFNMYFFVISHAAIKAIFSFKSLKFYL